MNEFSPVVAGLLSQAFHLHQNNQLEQAARLYRSALQMAPMQADALHLLGVLEGDLGHGEVAVELIQRAIRVRPRFAEAHLNLGGVLRRMQRFEEALASYDEALKIRGDFADAHFNRGNVLQDLRRFDEACESYMRATALQPDFADAYNNCGSIYWKAGRFEEAWRCYDKVVSLQPGQATGWVNLGSAHEKLGQTENALACYQRAQKIEPDNVAAHWNESHCLLMQGDYERGWQKYEWRWKGPQKDQLRDFAQPLWRGDESLQGRTILLHAEQGLGDTFQFCRYASVLAASGARVVLEVQPTLVGLLKSLPGVDHVVARGEALAEFDYHCPIVSLPNACNTSLQTVPAQVPYLFADDMLIARWHERLGEKRGLRVGVVWTTTTTIGNKRIPLPQVASLCSFGVELFGMQKDLSPAEEEALRQYPALRNFGNEFEDFSDTAAFATLMDVIISVDTSVAHMAAAMGKATWLLLPHVADWRWLKSQTDSPWYPTARLFRQPTKGNWDSVMQQVAECLRNFNAATGKVEK